MFINIEDLIEPPNTFYPPKSGTTIVIDNGSYECKAGYQGSRPQMVFKNRFYKSKHAVSLDPIPQSTVKTMFEGELVANYENMENTFDEIFQYLRCDRVYEAIITECLYNPRMLRKQTLSLMFEVYGCNKLQLGVDAVYSYLFNISNPAPVGMIDLIVDLSHNSTTVILINEMGIIDGYKINFGGAQALEYLLMLIRTKLIEPSTKIKSGIELLKYLKCANDYKKETLDMAERIRTNGEGVYLGKIVNKVNTRRNTGNAFNFRAKKNNKNDSNGEINEELKNETDEEKDNGSCIINIDLLNKDDSVLTKEEIKEKRRSKMIYYSSIYRAKIKSEKYFKIFKKTISSEEEEYERRNDLDAYLQKIKNKHCELKAEKRQKERIRKNLLDKRSREYAIKQKMGSEDLSPEEESILVKIMDAEDSDGDLEKELDKYTDILLRYDPEFVPYEYKIYEILRGDHLYNPETNGITGYDLPEDKMFGEGVYLNIELMQVPEVLFTPSIISLQQPGLTEIFEEIGLKYNLKRVFLTGGFSRIQNLEGRIKREIQKCSFNGKIEVVVAQDPRFDPFRGAIFSKIFPTYTKDEFEECGIEYLLDKKI
ncbi:Actin-like protein arp5 [Astathelohania contejeani]|uniref:Actin-like protein arp5 n=1 Tax=Astathelohania contejeani TaxID=164912 RepID=A0ABQ7I2T2_9MICR|nr:Actin-like protein arp5 [Thelohania contejeani]